MADQISQKDQAQIQSCLESFLKINDQFEGDAAASGSCVRESNGTYYMNNQKYMIKRKAKEEMLQYATLYFLRLEKLRPMVKDTASMKWLNSEIGISKNLKIVDNILDIKPFEETIIIGTLFKEQKLKPSILKDIMGVLGQKKFHDAEGNFLYGDNVNREEDDVAVLEDKSGRITIKNTEKFNINNFVSGGIMALKGKAINGGYFQVSDFCFAGIPFPSYVPEGLNTNIKRDLYDKDALQQSSGRRFVALLSGIHFGQEASQIHTDLLLRFFRGEFPDSRSKQLVSQIQRVVIAGDSMVQPEKVDEVLRGSYRTSKLNVEVYEDISHVMETFEFFLDQLSETIDVDVMPGEHDFSNSFLPQQPFNSCLFPQLADKRRESINLVTNPHQFDMNGLTFLGTSGQNIRDMMLNSLGTDGAKDEGTKCLDTIKQTLEMRHLMPTAPDTLRVYPFQASDPFVVSPLDNNLNLGEDEEQAEETSKTQFTQVPHVYFVGNMEAYKEELIVNDANCQQCLKVVSLPTFAKTHSIVLLDLQTLESYEVAFDMSEGVIPKEKLQSVIVVEEKQRYAMETMEID